MRVFCIAEDESRMVVTWVTFEPTNSTEVRYGPSGQGLTRNATGSVKEFIDKELIGSTIRYIHRVNITGLQPLSKYGKPYRTNLHVAKFT